MYCQECGIENKKNSLRCSKSKSYLNVIDSPLRGWDRVKIISFFIFLILPFAWFGISIFIILIILIALYVMKKDQNFTPIINAKKYVKIYLIFIGIFFTIMTAIDYYEHNKNIRDYERYNQAIKQFPHQEIYYWEYTKYNPKIGIETGMVVIAGLVIIPIEVTFFMFIFNNLFFRPLEEHKNWVIKNGVFSDEKNKNNIIGRDNLTSYSVADEMLKWNDLLEKGLITKQEFEKVKAKLLKEEKV